ncbi:MAG: hypothetical protein MK171_06850 [Pirellulales bacterium]|nr:hypothetical protein [Pirellulales bacterium]
MATFSGLSVVFAADVGQIVFAVIVFIFYIVGHVLSAKDNAKDKPRRNRPPVAPVGNPDDPVLTVEPPKPEGRAPADQAESLRSEIEDFVRRAKGKPPQREQPTPTPKLQPGRQTVDNRQTLPQQPRRLPQLQQEELQPQLEPRADGVAEHVTKHLSSRHVTENAEQLGGQLSQVDKPVEKFLQSKFDRQLGRLEHAEMVTDDTKPTQDVAGEIAAMLRSPEDMRQLIIAHEILRRPDWK